MFISQRDRGRVSLRRLGVVTAVGLALVGCAKPEAESGEASSAQGASALTGCVVTATPSVASPQKVGTRLRWTATASPECGAAPVFRFSVSAGGGESYRMARDYAKRAFFDWAPLSDGSYSVRVEAKPDYAPASVATASASSYAIEPYSNLPVAVRTGHPLVALYSAPACKKGRSIHVELVEAPAEAGPVPYGHDDLHWKSTSELPCVSGKSVSFLVAGMKPETTYWIRHRLDVGKAHWADHEVFTTGAIPPDVTLPTFTVYKPVDELTDTSADVAWNSLMRTLPSAAIPLATNLEGTPLWYWHLPTFAAELSTPQPTRTVAGGTVNVFARDAESPAATTNAAWTLLRNIDLAGAPRWETSANAVSARTNTGPNPFRIWGFHHDSVPLDNGNIAIIAYTLRCISPDFSISTDGSYTCPAGTSLWVGDAIVVLDPEGQVVWKWNGFDAGHFDPARPAPLAYPVCTAGDCGVFGAKSYTHMNALALMKDPSGTTQLLANARFQNWTVKVDFADGAGDGTVLWRMGAGGSFATSDPSNWYSHPHNVHFIGDGSMLVFDNGNNRCAGFDQHFCPSSSRGQVWNVDQTALAANPTLNFSFDDLVGLDGVTPYKAYSDALGAAQKLSNGNYAFVIGAAKPSTCGNASCSEPRHAYMMEVGFRNGVATQSFTYKLNGRNYRAFRMHTLYEGSDR